MKETGIISQSLFYINTMTPDEITTLIATNLDREFDVPFKKQLYERVKYWRGTLIKQALDRAPNDAKFFRAVAYIPMAKVNTLECVPGMECFAAVSTVDLPRSLRVTDAGYYSYVGSIDGLSPFAYADAGTRRYLQSGKYSQNFTYYGITGLKIVVTNDALPLVRIEGIPDDIEDWAPYADCKGPNPNCDWWKTDIPMTSDIAQKIVQCILTVDYNRPDGKEDHQVQVDETKQ